MCCKVFLGRLGYSQSALSFRFFIFESRFEYQLLFRNFIRVMPIPYSDRIVSIKDKLVDNFGKHEARNSMKKEYWEQLRPWDLPCLIRDRSKSTGYLGRVLGKICLRKVSAPLFTRQKVFVPLIFSEKKNLCPLSLIEKKSLRPLHFFRQKLLAPFFISFAKNSPICQEMKTKLCINHTPMNTLESFDPK